MPRAHWRARLPGLSMCDAAEQLTYARPYAHVRLDSGAVRLASAWPVGWFNHTH